MSVPQRARPGTSFAALVKTCQDYDAVALLALLYFIMALFCLSLFATMGCSASTGTGAVGLPEVP